MTSFRPTASAAANAEWQWAVDQDGYILDGDVIRRAGGPLRYFRPLRDNPGLFLHFAHLGDDVDAILSFVNAFGLTGEMGEAAPLFPFNPLAPFGLATTLLPAGLEPPVEAQSIDEIRAARAEVARLVDIVTAARAEGIRPALGKPRGIFATFGAEGVTLEPTTLVSAMHLQLRLWSISGAEFRRCGNPRCPEWIPIDHAAGGGARSRKYCSNRCNVAAHRARAQQKTTGD